MKFHFLGGAEEDEIKVRISKENECALSCKMGTEKDPVYNFFNEDMNVDFDISQSSIEDMYAFIQSLKKPKSKKK